MRSKVSLPYLYEPTNGCNGPPFQCNMNRFQTIPHSFFQINFNIILQSKSRSTKWLLTCRSCKQHFACISDLSLKCYILPLFHQYNKVFDEFKLHSSSVCSFIESPVTSSPWTQIFSLTSCSQSHSTCFPKM
jgi:hypothetical protein